MVINWIQVSGQAWNEVNGNFMIFPTIDGKWELHSKVKGKFYRYNALEYAFQSAKNIADAYPNEHQPASVA